MEWVALARLVQLLVFLLEQEAQCLTKEKLIRKSSFKMLLLVTSWPVRNCWCWSSSCRRWRRSSASGISHWSLIINLVSSSIKAKHICYITCWTGAFFLGPPGLGGESLGFSPVGNQSFFTGAGSGVVYVAIVTSPKRKVMRNHRNIKVKLPYRWFARLLCKRDTFVTSLRASMPLRRFPPSFDSTFV